MIHVRMRIRLLLSNYSYTVYVALKVDELQNRQYFLCKMHTW